jgi:hypothetical protein
VELQISGKVVLLLSFFPIFVNPICKLFTSLNLFHVDDPGQRFPMEKVEQRFPMEKVEFLDPKQALDLVRYEIHDGAS